MIYCCFCLNAKMLLLLKTKNMIFKKALTNNAVVVISVAGDIHKYRSVKSKDWLLSIFQFCALGVKAEPFSTQTILHPPRGPVYTTWILSEVVAFLLRFSCLRTRQQHLLLIQLVSTLIVLAIFFRCVEAVQPHPQFKRGFLYSPFWT